MHPALHFPHQRDFDGFSSAWYALVAPQVVMTMMILVFSPHIVSIVVQTLLRPIYRAWSNVFAASQVRLPLQP